MRLGAGAHSLAHKSIILLWCTKAEIMLEKTLVRFHGALSVNHVGFYALSQKLFLSFLVDITSFFFRGANFRFFYIIYYALSDFTTDLRFPPKIK